jgi:Anti-CBASS protein Acb1-like
MTDITLNSSASGTAFQEILMTDDIQPGSEPSYQMCKLIYLYHPMGAKMVKGPVTIAMSKRRKISVPSSPESVVVDAFNKEWDRIRADQHISAVMHTKRIYGISGIVYGSQGVPTDRPIERTQLGELDLYFNVIDPLNAAGAWVLNQDPNAPDFQKPKQIRVMGKNYHPSRGCVVMNEEPIYIAYTSSGFGFVGRSVYQRALFPLKSYIQSMITNDMVITKAGIIIAKLKAAGSIVDNLMKKAAGLKRNLLREAKQGTVINIDVDESVDTLDLNNTDTAMTTARKNIIEDIASSADMPPKLLLADGYASVLANGTEDFKSTMQYIDSIREDMKPLYEFFDHIVMLRAWNPDFYKTVQAQFPEEYGAVAYTTALYRWMNDFSAEWPSLQEEPESDQADADKVKLDAISSIIENLLPALDPENKAKLIEWAADNINDNKTMFTNPLIIDPEVLQKWLQKQDEQGGLMGGEEGARMPPGQPANKLQAVT